MNETMIKSRLFGGPREKVSFNVLKADGVSAKRLVVFIGQASGVYYSDEAREAYDDLMASGVATGPNPFAAQSPVVSPVAPAQE